MNPWTINKTNIPNTIMRRIAFTSIKNAYGSNFLSRINGHIENKKSNFSFYVFDYYFKVAKSNGKFYITATKQNEFIDVKEIDVKNFNNKAVIDFGSTQIYLFIMKTCLMSKEDETVNYILGDGYMDKVPPKNDFEMILGKRFWSYKPNYDSIVCTNIVKDSMFGYRVCLHVSNFYLNGIVDIPSTYYQTYVTIYPFSNWDEIIKKAFIKNIYEYFGVKNAI